MAELASFWSSGTMINGYSVVREGTIIRSRNGVYVSLAMWPTFSERTNFLNFSHNCLHSVNNDLSLL